VVLSVGPPSTANLNRFYTVEFFVEVRRALRPGGVLVLSLPTSGAYVGRRTREANGAVYRSLTRSFGHVAVSTEEYGLFAASDSPLETDPERLRMRFMNSGVRTEVFHPSAFQDAFAPLRVLLHRNRLEEAGAVNTDLRPMAYLLNLMLWAEVQGSRVLGAALEHGTGATLLLLAAFAGAGGLALRNRRRTLWMSSLSTGYAAMAMVMAVMLGFQAAYGYVYEMFGLLSALFMGGVAVGSRVARGGRMRGLALIEVGVALLAAAPMVVFAGRAFFLLYSLGAGVVTGCAFRAVNLRVQGEDPVRAGGMLYGFDLLGSFLGALLSAVFFVPVLGIRESLLVACAMKAGSAALAMQVRDE
jgi:spermidine synthase